MRVNILGVGVSATSMAQALQESHDLLMSNKRGYICVTGVHGIIEAQDDSAFREILNSSFITTPDGMPTVWIGRICGFREMTRVYGPDFMLELCESSVAKKYRHFLYGGKPGVAESLKLRLETLYPGIQIVGTYCPPFRPLTDAEEENLHQLLEELKPDILWCGLSTPKQERFMYEHRDSLPVKLMVGVGAAFDINSGNLKDAPPWMKNIGMQWLHRLFQEPRRLAKRYLLNNPRFLGLVTLQGLKLKRYSL